MSFFGGKDQPQDNVQTVGVADPEMHVYKPTGEIEQVMAMSDELSAITELEKSEIMSAIG